jgi:CoA:oxalate CoA-transferase
MSGPLAGTRVLELANFTAGPLCGELLAQLGAEVIKVEPPGGEQLRRLPYRVDGTSYLFHINNAGKRCVTANIKDEHGRGLVLDLAAKCDVFIENFAPGALDRAGLGYATLRDLGEHLIYCSLNGFGSNAPFSDKRAYDTVVQGLSGLISLTGRSAKGPLKIGPSIADLMGAVACTTAVTAAIYHQRATGQGQRIEMALYDVAVWLTEEVWPGVLAAAGDGGAPTERQARDTYDAMDGLVAIAVETDEHWDALCGVLGMRGVFDGAQYGTGAGRAPWPPEVEGRLQLWAGERTAAEAAAALQEAGVPAAPVLELAQIPGDPHVRAREMVVELPVGDGGSMLMPGSPFRLSETPGAIERPAERPGQSNADIYGAVLGLSGPELETLAAQGAI